MGAAAKGTWSAQRALEVAGVTATYNAIRAGIETWKAKTDMNTTIKEDRAMLDLRDQRTLAEKQIRDQLAQRRANDKKLIDSLKLTAKTKTTALQEIGLGQTPTSSGIIPTAQGMLDKGGSFYTSNIATWQQATIPGLQNEYAGLLATQPPPNEATAIDSALLENLQLQLGYTQQLLEASTAQTAILGNLGNLLPPYGGSFATGGVVPGPLGEARTIIAHGGETVTPLGGDPTRVAVRVEDHRTRVWVDDVEHTVNMANNRAVRHARRGLAGNGGGMGF
jgi:hypothetical protein